VCAVGVAPETSGPGTDDWPGLTSFGHIPVAEDVARHLYVCGLDASFDLTLSEEFTIDHSISVPLEMLNPAMERPMVPFWINGIAPPLPLARRVYAAGRMVRQAIERKDCHCTTEVFMWSSIVHQPKALIHAMVAARAWRKPVAVNCESS